MRVICPFCLQKARIVSRQPLNEAETIAKLYCHCTQVQSCGATFAYMLAYDYVLDPPAKNVLEMAQNLVARGN